MSDVCRALRLAGGVYFRAAFSGEWAIEVPASRGDIRFHLCTSGTCDVVVGERSCTLERGDVVLVPHGAAQVLSSSGARVSPVRLAAALETNLHDDELRVLAGGSSPTVRLLCGFCTVDDVGGHPLFAGLPALISLPRDAAPRAPWIRDAVRLLTYEAQHQAPGMQAIATRLIEVLFIQTIRDWAGSEQNDQRGFLAALGNTHVSRALGAIHRDPARDWTVSSLAREAGLSRSRFALLFVSTTGQPPMAYLRQWRLLSARRLLRESRLGVDAIAQQVGYRSVPSFTRRFGSAFGITPAALRKRFREDHDA